MCVAPERHPGGAGATSERCEHIQTNGRKDDHEDHNEDDHEGKDDNGKMEDNTDAGEHGDPAKWTTATTTTTTHCHPRPRP